jgi:hypothetical protein
MDAGSTSHQALPGAGEAFTDDVGVGIEVPAAREDVPRCAGTARKGTRAKGDCALRCGDGAGRARPGAVVAGGSDRVIRTYARVGGGAGLEVSPTACKDCVRRARGTAVGQIGGVERGDLGAASARATCRGNGASAARAAAHHASRAGTAARHPARARATCTSAHSAAAVSGSRAAGMASASTTDRDAASSGRTARTAHRRDATAAPNAAGAAHAAGTEPAARSARRDWSIDGLCSVLAGSADRATATTPHDSCSASENDNA